MRKLIVAKYPGKCCRCGKPITRGDEVIFEGKGRVSHQSCCEPEVSQEDYPCSDMGYEDQCAARCGL